MTLNNILQRVVLGIGLSAILLILNSCENGIVGTGEKPEPTVTGIAQKGPFVMDSNVKIIVRPGPDYNVTDTVQVQTLDGIGSFEFTFEADTLYEITVSGQNFNEVTGELTTESIELHSTYYHDQSMQPFVSINLLTHLIHSRIKYLIDNDHYHPRQATEMARQELILGLSDVIFADHFLAYSFSNMAVYNHTGSNPVANAVLLFISAAFYKQSTLFENSVPLVEMINYIAADLELDGKLDDVEPASANTSYISSLDLAAHRLNPDEITQHLTNYSIETTGTAIPVPDIRFLLDNDGDGITNNIDLDDDGDGFPDITDDKPYEFEIIPKPQSISTLQDVPVSIILDFNRPEEHLLKSIFVENSVAPEHGIVEPNSNVIIYKPTIGFTGTDSFQYVVLSVNKINGVYRSTPGTVIINVTLP